MNRYFFICISLGLTLLFGCNNDDENLKPAGVGPDWFVIQNKPGRFNELAYQIYSETGMPMFVNDTLGVENRGTDSFGNPIIHYEMFVIDYSIFNQVYRAAAVLSADTTAMVKAAELIRDEVLPRYYREYKPASILLVDTLYAIDRGWSSVQGVKAYKTQEYAHKNMIGTVVGHLSDILKMTEDEQNMWVGRILAEEITDEIQVRYADEVKEFCNVSLRTGTWTWHGESRYADLEGKPAGSLGYDVDYRELGFLEWIWDGVYSEDRLVRRYPTEYIDVAGYIAAVYAYSEERFESLYQDFPKFVEKFKMMKAILAKFDAEMNK